MLTNNLHKGDRVILENGFEAKILDNRKGITRLCEVHGIHTEIGSVYSYNMTHYFDNETEQWQQIELTDHQRRIKTTHKELYQ